jgi:hypothetical protein
MASSFLSRWAKTESDDDRQELLPPLAEGDRPVPTEAISVGKRPTSGMVSWSASPSLEKISREFEEQLRAIEEVRRYLEDRISPFQRHVAKQRRNVDQALKQLEARVRPLRQYLEGQEQNLGRVSQHLSAELRNQFDAFGRFLAEQQRILETATRYLDDQPRPLQRYYEDQHRIVELVYKEIEEKLEPFGRFLKEQQRVLEAIAAPQVLEEFEALAGYLQERERAFERFSLSPDHRPIDLFAELDEIYNKCKSAQTGAHRLMMVVLEETRLSDDRLREVLRPGPREMAETRPGDEPRAEG